MTRAFISAAITVLSLVGLPATARAATIEYATTNVAGSTWEYEYFPGGTSFLIDQGFTVYFDPTLYADLHVDPTLPADWDPLTVDPIPALASNGYYDALALTDGPSLSGPFRVIFTWLGVGTPGSQPFDLYQLDTTGAPIAFGSGVTRPVSSSVPEPASLTLLLTAATLYGRRRVMRRAG